jgi:type VI secretion system protein ImpJ
MQHPPVHWSEGLFLTAQHFQASERHWGEVIFRSATFSQAYYYGLRDARFSADAIANLGFQLDACEARTRSGAIISFGEGSEPGRVSLKEALDSVKAQSALKSDLGSLASSAGAVRVYLAVPKLRIGTKNVGRRGDQGLFRFVEVPPVALQDESTGGNDQEVSFKAFNARLIVKSPRTDAAAAQPGATFDDDDPDYDLLPIAQIRRAGEAGPELDESYIPPIVSVDAWPPLQRGIMQKIYDWIGNRIETLSEQVAARQITLASQEPGDVDRLLMLMRLNEAQATLSVVAFAKGIHPLTAYWTLAQIVGQLAIFAPARRTPMIPQYDHDNLGYIFRYLMEKLRELLDIQRFQLPYFFRPFEGRGLGMQVTFEPEWMGSGFKWYIGVNYHNINAQQCRNILAPNALHWKLGSARQVEGLFQTQKPGLLLIQQDNAPKELPSNEWIYYEVTRTGDAWPDVVATQSLAMRYKDTLVDNRESLEGERTLVINVPPKKVELQFGLFAVPSRT